MLLQQARPSQRHRPAQAGRIGPTCRLDMGLLQKGHKGLSAGNPLGCPLGRNLLFATRRRFAREKNAPVPLGTGAGEAQK